MVKIPPILRHAPEVTQRLHEALLEERAQETYYNDRLGIHELGGCVRNLWGKMHGIPSERQIDGQALVTFKLGHKVEELIVELLRLAGYEVRDRDAKGKQFEAILCDGKLVGHVDGFVKISHIDYVLEVKSAKQERFDKLLLLGSYEDWDPAYAYQLQAYMDIFNKVRALVVVLDKNRSLFYVEKIGRNSQLRGAYVDRVTRILCDDVPDRPEGATSQFCAYCKWCDRNRWCWSTSPEVTFDR